MHVGDDPPNIEAIIDCKRYGSKIKLLRVTAWVRRFIYILRSQKKPAVVELNAVELQEAEKIWVNGIQRNRFQEETLYLQRKSKKETLLARQLNIFLDKDRTIRCRGRIEHSSLSMSAKNPMLLPTKHYFTELVISECHKVVHHNGVKETLNAIREVYWIPRGREVVKRVIRACVTCRKHEGKIASLPTSRVSDDAPFVHTGMDFAGPLYLKGVDNERVLEKAYVCLFTCASTRALHLELVPNLSVNTFLQSFRRFTARRGLPSKLLSDNAKTFKAAAKEVKAIVRSTEIQRYLANRGIMWDLDR